MTNEEFDSLWRQDWRQLCWKADTRENERKQLAQAAMRTALCHAVDRAKEAIVAIETALSIESISNKHVRTLLEDAIAEFALRAASVKNRFEELEEAF